MTWQQVFFANVTHSLNPAPINYVFTKGAIIVSAVCATAQISWHKAGTLTPIIDIPEIGITKGLRRRVYLKKQLIEFDQLNNSNYKLEFWLYGWIPNVELTIWQNDSVEYVGGGLF